MNRDKVFYLWIAAGLFITLAVFPASAETATGDSIILANETGEINFTEYSTTSYNETEVIETELGLGFKFLASSFACFTST